MARGFSSLARDAAVASSRHQVERFLRRLSEALAAGNELFYVNAERFLHRVTVTPTADGHLEFGTPEPVQIPRFAERHWGTVYDVSPDGSRVYFPHPGPARAPHEFGVVSGWRALLQR